MVENLSKYNPGFIEACASGEYPAGLQLYIRLGKNKSLYVVDFIVRLYRIGIPIDISIQLRCDKIVLVFSTEIECENGITYIFVVLKICPAAEIRLNSSCVISESGIIVMPVISVKRCCVFPRGTNFLFQRKPCEKGLVINGGF